MNRTTCFAAIAMLALAVGCSRTTRLTAYDYSLATNAPIPPVEVSEQDADASATSDDDRPRPWKSPHGVVGSMKEFLVGPSLGGPSLPAVTSIECKTDGIFSSSVDSCSNAAGRQQAVAFCLRGQNMMLAECHSVIFDRAPNDVIIRRGENQDSTAEYESTITPRPGSFEYQMRHWEDGRRYRR